jgi:hypothetical protein
MSKPKRKRLEDAGWKVGGSAEQLGLSEAEKARVEARLAESPPGEPRARKAQASPLARASRRRPGSSRPPAAPR